MKIPKLKVLIEAGAVREVDAMPEAAGGWSVWITYSRCGVERREPLERQRGGARIFATLDAVARTLRAAGVGEFRVINPRSGEGSSDDR
mgnify:CR=1 FL=1